MTTQPQWITLCSTTDLIKHSGVCALVKNTCQNDEQQVALFQINEDEVYAVGNWDPVGEANVLYRGLVGDHQGEAYVASPLYKQRFSLKNGQCLDDETVNIQCYQTRIENDQVQICA